MFTILVKIALAGSSLHQAGVLAAPSTPRGVAPDYVKHYQKDTFSCLFNPSITLSPSQINDDYCDCPDGSDEPGTSACSHISSLSPPSVLNSNPALNHTAALPGFYCQNVGHNPAFIPFSYINDGVCDHELCCDGSDEWARAGGVKCENKCREIGTVWQKKDTTRRRARAAALAQRADLVARSTTMKAEIEKTITDLKMQLEDDELKIKQATQELSEEEKKDKLRTIRAPTSGGKMGTLVSLAKKRIEDLRQALLKSHQDKYSVEFRVKELEGILESFKTEYNPNFNDEGVKRAVRAWEDYEARGRFPSHDHAGDKEVEDLGMDDSQHGIVWEDYETEGRDTDALYAFEAYLPPSLREWVSQKYIELRVFLVENGILATTNEDTSESKSVTDARDKLQTAERERDNRQSDLNTKEQDLSKSYGPDDIFLALKNECIQVDSGEYTYEHCFLDKTMQKPNKGGMDTNMGYFERIEWITVDEEEPLDGKGLGSGERIALKYENGAQCWNGPARSTTVILACAEKNEIWRVIEEEKCSYRMEAGSPAACSAEEGSDAAGTPKVKDEL